MKYEHIEKYKEYLKKDKDTLSLTNIMCEELDKKLSAKSKIKHKRSKYLLFAFHIGIIIWAFGFPLTIQHLYGLIEVMNDIVKVGILLLIALPVLTVYFKYQNNLFPKTYKPIDCYGGTFCMEIEYYYKEKIFTLKQCKSRWFMFLTDKDNKEVDQDIIDFIKELADYAECLQKGAK